MLAFRSLDSLSRFLNDFVQPSPRAGVESSGINRTLDTHFLAMRMSNEESIAAPRCLMNRSVERTNCSSSCVRRVGLPTP